MQHSAEYMADFVESRLYDLAEPYRPTVEEVAARLVEVEQNGYRHPYSHGWMQSTLLHLPAVIERGDHRSAQQMIRSALAASLAVELANDPVKKVDTVPDPVS